LLEKKILQFDGTDFYTVADFPDARKPSLAITQTILAQTTQQRTRNASHCNVYV